MQTMQSKSEAIYTPPFYNDLNATLTHAWALLARGTVDRRSAFHTPSVASIASDGSPTQRTMILRKVDVAARTLRFHSDIRSIKIDEWQKNSRASVLAYSVSDKIQLRLSGAITIDQHTPQVDNIWANMRAQSRVGYAQTDTPGAAIDAPNLTPPPLEILADAPLAHMARENFCLLTVNVEQLDWVFLSLHGNRRAQFSWPLGVLHAQWLAP